jgi:hypothetical protein
LQPGVDRNVTDLARRGTNFRAASRHHLLHY